MEELLNSSPVLSIINGQYSLSIPQYALLCLGYIYYGHLNTNVSNTSKLAKNSWGAASKEFKEFYREYTKNVFN
ncbi:hypothetical protein RhiirA4_547245 [Rhizophagus irregularis]|uniref:Uncharacterized protein n=1 Tax=Rhizophagus irregularis TaxID=588596 RepID=A0A2I1H158_9GLOM|nr:hypothetical protein RhiirA4_547245 [Rhizophagus irregularis]